MKERIRLGRKQGKVFLILFTLVLGCFWYLSCKSISQEASLLQVDPQMCADVERYLQRNGELFDTKQSVAAQEGFYAYSQVRDFQSHKAFCYRVGGDYSPYDIKLFNNNIRPVLEKLCSKHKGKIELLVKIFPATVADVLLGMDRAEAFTIPPSNSPVCVIESISCENIEKSELHRCVIAEQPISFKRHYGTGYDRNYILLRDIYPSEIYKLRPQEQ